MRLSAMASVLVFTMLSCSSAQAQGLLWSLPEDGSWVRYEGTYEQTVRRPDSTEGDLVLRWQRNLTIKSVGREDAEFQGQTQPCRWIEIKAETGKTTEGVLDPGPGGIRMYRLLVPESAIRGTVNEPVGNGREIFAAYIPIVKGERRIGDEPAQNLESGVFQLYPMVSLLRHYRRIDETGREKVDVPAGTFGATILNGEMKTETPSYRSTDTCELARSEEIPFGVVKWTASTVGEIKGTIDQRKDYRENSILKEVMQAVSTGTEAESDFLLD